MESYEENIFDIWQTVLVKMNIALKCQCYPLTHADSIVKHIHS